MIQQIRKFCGPIILVTALLIGLAACSSRGATDEPSSGGGSGDTDQENTLSDSSTDNSSMAGDQENMEGNEQDSGGNAGPSADSTEEQEAAQSYAGKIAAPKFPEGLDWLNTEQPLSLSDLKGKIVLLDFWTYGCINCMHIIPDLKKLEEKYADELVVIGVHSAKFENEGETENIRNVIVRYELEHPVVNDNEFQIWNTYGARAWPTLVLIDPDGRVLGYHSGEGIYEPFDEVIAGMIEEFDALGKIDRTPLDLRLEREGQPNSPLLFPGKVLADEASQRLFIADSNHNRLVITDLEGNVLEVIGNGQASLQDGDFETASFYRPQGLTLADEDTLYVADTENNVIRLVDLAKRSVETVAGTGEQVYAQNPGGIALETPLNSPWDVLFEDGKLYIAMAGQHQIWMYDPADHFISGYAGSGREELRDGPLMVGGLNQPSGLATDGKVLYIADSEASAIRTADLDPQGDLETIVGTGLFDFGDVDGQGDAVRLQHPLGIVYDDGNLYIADTYNSKIKVIDPENRESQTFLGTGESGWRDGGEPLFNEPGGLSLLGDRLYIADTNNHVIRVADLNNREVSTLVLIDNDGLLTRQPDDVEYTGKVVTLEPQEVAPGMGEIQLNVALPDGYKVNDLAPFSMEWSIEGDGVSFNPEESNQRLVEPKFPLSFPAEFSQGASEVSGDLIIYYCEAESQSLCLIERIRVTAPVTVRDGADSTLLVDYTIPNPAGALLNQG